VKERMDDAGSNVSPLHAGEADLARAEEQLRHLLDTPVDADVTWALVRDGIGLDHRVTKLRPRRRRIRAFAVGVAAALLVSGAAFGAVSQRGGPVVGPLLPPGHASYHRPGSTADPDRLGADVPTATPTPSVSGGSQTGGTSSSDADVGSSAPGAEGSDQQGQDQSGQDQQPSDPTSGQDQGKGQSGSSDGTDTTSSDGGTSQGGDGNQSSSPSPTDTQS
jgi:hypothetical protein